MLSYCLKCRKNTEENPKVVKTRNGRMMVLWKFLVCNSKNSEFFKVQETRVLLRNLKRIKIPIPSKLSIINTLF